MYYEVYIMSVYEVKEYTVLSNYNIFRPWWGFRQTQNKLYISQRLE